MRTRIFSTIRLFRSALSGKDHNLTGISIDRAIFLLAVPMIIEMLMESLFAVADIFFVSRLGKEAVAAVGLTESILTLIYSIGFGISMAATAVVARRIGEKNKEGAQLAAGQTILVGIAVSIVVSFAGIFFSEEILRLLGAPEEVISIGKGYMQWMLGGNYVILLLFLMNGIFRGAGNAAVAMNALWLSNTLNVILDPLLIFGLGPIPAFGMDGAAYATNIGRGFGVGYQLYILLGGKGFLKVAARHFRVNRQVISRIISISLGGTGQFIIASASWIVLMHIMSGFDSAALAGYTIGIRVLIFTILPAWGLANAAATLVGQNLGAEEPERAEKSVWRTAFFNMLFLGFVSVIYFFTAEFVVGLFSEEAAVIQYGKECLQYICIGYVFFAYGMVMAQGFNGAGDTRTPTLLNFFGFWIVQIPLAYMLAVSFRLGPKGVFLAVAIAESLMAVMAVFLFRRGKWKLTKV